MRSQKYHPNYTVEDYRQWKGDWELIDGIPSAMTPSPSKQHQLLAYELSFQLGLAFKNSKDTCGSCRPIYETDWVIDEFTVVRPDIAVICNDNEGESINVPPALIIEIVSPSSGLKDRHTKYGIYEEQKVLYYIIVDPKLQSFSIYVLNSAGIYEEMNDLTTFKFGTCIINISLATTIAEANL